MSPHHQIDTTPVPPPNDQPLSRPDNQRVPTGTHGSVDGFTSIVGGFLASIVRLATRLSALMVLVFIALAVLAGWYTATNLKLDTDTTDMIDERVAFRQHYQAYVANFPDPRGAIIAIVEASHPGVARDQALALKQRLGDEITAIENVEYVAGLPFFQENGLLFLSVDELDALSAALAEAQPIIATLAQSPNLLGLTALHETVLAAVLAEQADETALTRLDPILTIIAETIEKRLTGEPQHANWEALFDLTPGSTEARDGVDGGISREYVIIYPVLDTQSLQPAARAIQAIEQAVSTINAETQSTADEITVALTGEPVLAQEEMETVIVGAGLAGLLSLVLVTLILGFGLASITLITAILTTLIMGLVITAGLATLVVGSLNLISVAFAVLFVGLAVDFAIHYALRYREALGVMADKPRALIHAAGQYGVGPALVLCSACTLIGFLAFLPTSYRGLAELGLISALGMATATLTSLMLLPALLRLLPAPKAPRTKQRDVIQQQATQRFAKPITGIALILFLACLPLVALIDFDVNPLNLRDPNSASVKAFNILTADPLTTPYRGQISLPDAEAVRALMDRAADEPLIGPVISALSFVPDNQFDKQDILFDLGFVIGPSLEPVADDWKPTEPEALSQSLRTLSLSLERSPTVSPASVRLLEAIDNLQTAQDTDAGILPAVDRLIGYYLHHMLSDLRTALDAGTVALDDLPAAINDDWRGPNGVFRVDILPAEPITSNAELARYADAITRVAPGATGTPDILTGASTAIANTFAKATAITLLLIILLLAIIQRRLVEVLLTLTPLVLAAAITIAVAVLIGQPFNFANVIALPLLFALGVCGAIHMVWRQRQLRHGSPESLETALSVEDTATPKAIILSALTTVASFGSLAISPHPGTASMGLLLSIALAATLLTTLVFLPALMAFWQSRRQKRRPLT